MAASPKQINDRLVQAVEALSETPHGMMTSRRLGAALRLTDGQTEVLVRKLVNAGLVEAKTCPHKGWAGGGYRHMDLRVLIWTGEKPEEEQPSLFGGEKEDTATEQLMEVAEKLKELVAKHSPTRARKYASERAWKKQRITWVSELKRMARVDKVEVEDMHRVLRWLLAGSWWSEKILSPQTLRKHWDRLDAESAKLNLNAGTRVDSKFAVEVVAEDELAEEVD